ncbi:MAG: hypothetical protein KDB03_24545 [Planctomycetales bacterium]|nr:hypothetical protein [Planctomycetales bacterium]
MEVHNAQSRQLDIRFRMPSGAEGRWRVPGGWPIWSGLGIAVGICFWLLMRQHLSETLQQQLAVAPSRSDALLALEGLVKLNDEFGLSVVAGLQHPDREVAKASYKALDGLLQRWEEAEDPVVTNRYHDLAEKLFQLPSDLPHENMMLIGSLASRLYATCMDYEPDDLNDTKLLCEKVIQRIAQASSSLQMARIIEPPPPLSPTVIAEPQKIEVQYTVQTLPQELASDSIRGSENVNSNDTEITASPQTIREGTPVPLENIHSAEMRLSDLDSTFHQPSVENQTDLTARSPSVEMATIAVSSRMMGAADISPLTRPQGTLLTLEQIQLLNTDEVVRLLGSKQHRVPQMAAFVLSERGMSDEDLVVASELANGSETQRLELLSRLSELDIEDPRPWLLWMAEDGETLVRGRAVGLLSSMLDVEVQRKLRLLMAKEIDEEIRQHIRTVLLIPPSHVLR